MSGIRVCTIQPGATESEIYDQVRDPGMRAFMEKHVKKEGAVKPEDVAAAVLLILSMPQRTNISMMHIRPTIDVNPG
jgi:NADP-dependent 3-hydroxy acid dehydrogenase YdfG